MEAILLEISQIASRQEQAEISRLLQEAWETARRAASLLREQFRATRVVVFGSLVHEACFTRWSDVNVAAWGIAPDDTLRAIGAVMDMDGPIKFNLVDVNACRPSLLEVIERDGINI